MPRRASSCRQRSLSRERPMATDSFKRIDAHHLELAQHGEAVERDRCADARDHRVEILEPPLAVIERRLARGDVDRDAKRIDHLDVVAALRAPPRRCGDGCRDAGLRASNAIFMRVFPCSRWVRGLWQRFARLREDWARLRRSRAGRCAEQEGAAGLDQRAAFAAPCGRAACEIPSGRDWRAQARSARTPRQA